MKRALHTIWMIPGVILMLSLFGCGRPKKTEDHTVDALPRETKRVMVLNEVQTADVWIVPQTDESLKSSLWGKAAAGKLGKGEKREVRIAAAEDGTYIVRIIDDEHAYYAVNDVTLDDGYSVRFTTADTKYDAVIGVYDADGNEVGVQDAFTGVFGAQ